MNQTEQMRRLPENHCRIIAKLLGFDSLTAKALQLFDERRGNGEDVAIYTVLRKFCPVVLTRK